MSLFKRKLSTSNALLLALVTATFSGQSIAQSSVWKAEKDGKHLYLGGTIHILSKTDYPLPEQYDAAYQKSELIYFETDIEQLKNPEMAGALMNMLLAEKGKTLDKVLKPETLAALDKFLKERQLSLDLFSLYNPSGVYLVLMTMELMNLGLMGSGVDEHFTQLAIEDKKFRGQLETIEQQMSFLSKIGEGNEDQLIMYGLRDMEKMPEMMAEMKATWRSGDRAKFRELLLNPFMKDFPSAYQSLLVERNKAWMPKIEAMFETPEIELVLVGALHMIGKEGLLQQLEAKGYTIEPYED